MCGLVGVMGPPTKLNQQIFKDLLIADVKRGPHSTGACFGYGGKAKVLKSTTLPWDFIDRKPFRDRLAENPTVMMGHNRFATVGKVTNKNAHPFRKGNVVLAHNGTLHKEWRDDFKHGDKYETDSECLAHEIHERGIEEVYKEIEGAATLSWLDISTGKLSLASNGQRPLHFMSLDSGKTVVYASEEWMLTMVSMARDLKSDSKPFSIPHHEHWSFWMGENSPQLSYSNEKLTPKPKKVFSFAGQATGGYKKQGNLTFAGEFYYKMTNEQYNKEWANKLCFLCQNPMGLSWFQGRLIAGDTPICTKCAVYAQKNDVVL